MNQSLITLTAVQLNKTKSLLFFATHDDDVILSRNALKGISQIEKKKGNINFKPISIMKKKRLKRKKSRIHFLGVLILKKFALRAAVPSPPFFGRHFGDARRRFFWQPAFA